VNQLQPDHEALIARVVKAVLTELGCVEQPRSASPLDPDANISDPDARRLLYGNCSRGKYWYLMREPDAPRGSRVGRSMVRKVRGHLEFIARREVS
jgi:hypothetical protein